MELRQLKYFVTVAEELQFSSASRKLLVSQPALSQQIKLLEEELGVDLFIKIKRQIYRKVELTEYNNRRIAHYFASVHPVFEAVEKMCIKAGFNRRPHIIQEVSSLDIMAQLVGMGKGIALVPSFFDTSAVSNIVNKPLEDTLIEFEQCLVFRADRFSEMSAVLK